MRGRARIRGPVPGGYRCNDRALPAATVDAIQRQLASGLTFMLPTEDAVWVGEELQRRFGLPFWQFTLTATDANRFALRLARQITHRPKILVYDYCYHGTVDESFITLRESIGIRSFSKRWPQKWARTSHDWADSGIGLA